MGFQLEVNQSISEQTSLALNSSIMSRHLTFENEEQLIERVNKNLLIIPSIENKYNPYWNVYSELEHYFKSGSVANIGLGHIFNSQYDYEDNEVSSEIKATFLPIYLSYMITPEYSVQLTSEIARISDNSVKYTNSIYTIAVSRTPSINISVDYEYVSKNVDDSDKKYWLSGTMLFRFKEKQLFEISYGEQRGGLVCKNGMCRYEPPVKGWRFNIVLSY